MMAEQTRQQFFVTGSAGMLGRVWQRLLESNGIAFEHADIDDIDITSPASLKQIEPGTTHIINCAAYTAVDKAEDEEQAATEINGRGVELLASRAAEIGATVVNYSTDYVFDGSATKPYKPDQIRDPLNAYGRSKAVGEQALEASDAAWLNIRTSWLYAPWGHNFVLTMARLTAEKDELKVVADQRGRPSSAVRLAESTLRLLNAGLEADHLRGHWHITDAGECTWHALTEAIADTTGAACRIAPCTSDEFPRPAKRPHYSVLDITKTEAVLGPLQHWKQSVADAIHAAGLKTPASSEH